MADFREVEFPFALERAEDDGDGLTLRGYTAVFNSPTPIQDQFGRYTEVIAPGSMKKTLERGAPPLLFDHGKHPLIGRMPLGKITVLREEPRGLYVEARLSDNWLIAPVRDAIRDGAVTGMSIKFEPVKVDDVGRGQSRTRTVREARLFDVGPVVSPAYKQTSVTVRSALDALAADDEFGKIVNISFRDEVIATQEPTVAEMVSDAIEQLWGLNDDQSDAYITNFYDDRAVFTVVGKDMAKYKGLWQVNYKYDNGNITIGAPTQVEAVQPRDASDEADGNEPADYNRSTSDDEAAASTSREAAATHGPTTVGLSKTEVLRIIQLRERGILTKE